ncbi:pentatricopeptide repeat-containing protein [Quercus suber]|uniref:Pentatricopeptide repeat-containing protein n=1 Tax=Quercus suber TaxID=58331 RepID=A0AAW0LLL5_QUESU
MSERDVGSWNSLISGLAQNSEGRNALFLFKKMRVEGAEVDVMTVSGVLSVCADLAALVNFQKGCGRLGTIEEGKQVHCIVFKHGFDRDMILMTSLLDMYCKCIDIKGARRVYDEMPQRDVVVNNNMIFGLCRCHLTLDAMTYV